MSGLDTLQMLAVCEMMLAAGLDLPYQRVSQAKFRD